MERQDDPASQVQAADVGYEQRLQRLAHAIQRQGRELEAIVARETDAGDSMTWMKARLALIVATCRNDLRADLTRTIGQIERVSATEGDWAILRRQLAAIEPEFADHIENRYPDMTLLEKKISLLIGLGLPMEEIAGTLRQPEKTVARCTDQILGRMNKFCAMQRPPHHTLTTLRSMTELPTQSA